MAALVLPSVGGCQYQDGQSTDPGFEMRNLGHPQDQTLAGAVGCGFLVIVVVLVTIVAVF
jgi:hypothetical protein